MFNTLMEWLHQYMIYMKDPIQLVRVAGYVGLTAIIFAETGLLVGFFLPGDSLLVAAGLFAARGDINVWLLGAILTAAAIIGDAVGYAIGRKTGPMLFKRKDSLLFRRSHLLKAQAFYEKHGGKTIVIARFVPIVRTFVPTVAGIAKMPYRNFAFYNVFGGFLWIWSMLLGGYTLGSLVPDIDKHIKYLLVGVILLSISPGIVAWVRARRNPQVEDETVVKEAH